MNSNELMEDFISQTTQFLVDYDVSVIELEEFLEEYVGENFFIDLCDDSQIKMTEFIMKLYVDL